ncbi:putative glycosyltransferase-like [Capsicum annuum]|nr:putative glycosyltransferase-like [Capsicum annuum]
MAAPFFSTPFQPFVYQSRCLQAVPGTTGGRCSVSCGISRGACKLSWTQLVGGAGYLVELVEVLASCPGLVGGAGYLVELVEVPASCSGHHWCKSPQDAVTPFQILGGEAQIVQIMLKPQEKIIAKPGSMCYMSGSIQMENVYAAENEAGIWQWLFGKNTTSIVLHNTGTTDGFVGIAAPSLARILPIDLAKFGGEILCQPDAFLCSINDVKVSNTIDQRPRNLVASAEGFLRQKISGQGLAFVVGGGSGMILNLTSIVNLEFYGKFIKDCMPRTDGGYSLSSTVLYVFVCASTLHHLKEWRKCGGSNNL